MSSYFGTADEVEAARAKRRKEIQSWAREDQDQADSLVGVPTSFDQDWDLVEIEDSDEPVEPAQPAEVVLDVKSADVPEIVDIEAPKIAKSAKPKPETTSKG